MGRWTELDFGPSPRVSGGDVVSGTSKEEWDEDRTVRAWGGGSGAFLLQVRPFPLPCCPGVNLKHLVLVLISLLKAGSPF